jgi:excisionase family DNA binding protein
MTAANDQQLPSYTVAELCDRWRCERRTIMDAIHAGRLRAFRPGKRVYRVAIAEVERYERTKDAA